MPISKYNSDGSAARGYSSQVTVTRPANVTIYSAGDVVGGAIAFTAIGPAGCEIQIVSTDLRADIAAVPAGMTTMRLHLYNVTPPSAIADNGVWDLPAGDRASYLGFIDLGTPADLGSTVYCQADNIQKRVKLGAGETALYGYLVSAGGFTPAANSEVYNPSIRAVAL